MKKISTCINENYNYNLLKNYDEKNKKLNHEANYVELDNVKLLKNMKKLRKFIIKDIKKGYKVSCENTTGFGIENEISNFHMGEGCKKENTFKKLSKENSDARYEHNTYTKSKKHAKIIEYIIKYTFNYKNLTYLTVVYLLLEYLIKLNSKHTTQTKLFTILNQVRNIIKINIKTHLLIKSLIILVNRKIRKDLLVSFKNNKVTKVIVNFFNYLVKNYIKRDTILLKMSQETDSDKRESLEYKIRQLENLINYASKNDTDIPPNVKTEINQLLAKIKAEAEEKKKNSSEQHVTMPNTRTAKRLFIEQKQKELIEAKLKLNQLNAKNPKQETNMPKTKTTNQQNKSKEITEAKQAERKELNNLIEAIITKDNSKKRQASETLNLNQQNHVKKHQTDNENSEVAEEISVIIKQDKQQQLNYTTDEDEDEEDLDPTTEKRANLNDRSIIQPKSLSNGMLNVKPIDTLEYKYKNTRALSLNSFFIHDNPSEDISYSQLDKNDDDMSIIISESEMEISRMNKIGTENINTSTYSIDPVNESNVQQSTQAEEVKNMEIAYDEMEKDYLVKYNEIEENEKNELFQEELTLKDAQEKQDLNMIGEIENKKITIGEKFNYKRIDLNKDLVTILKNFYVKYEKQIHKTTSIKILNKYTKEITEKKQSMQSSNGNKQVIQDLQSHSNTSNHIQTHPANGQTNKQIIEFTTLNNTGGYKHLKHNQVFSKLNKKLTEEKMDEKINDELELKYNRKSRTVFLRGSCTAFDTNWRKFNDREQELIRCKNITNTKTCDIVTCKKTNKLIIKIETVSYDDYKKLLEDWPLDAFTKGVKPEPGYIGVKMVMSVPNSKDLTQCPDEIAYFSKRYGLHELERTGRNKDENRVQMEVESVKHLVDRCAEKLVNFNVGAIQIKPFIRPTNPCENCLLLVFHRDGCKSSKHCMKCASNDPIHVSNGNCKNSPYCRNCHMAHPSNYKNCEAYKRKILLDNDWLATVMVGERIISNKAEILSWVSHELTIDPLTTVTKQTIDEESLKSMIETAINPIKNDFKEFKEFTINKFESNDKMINEIQSNFSTLNTKVEGLEKSIVEGVKDIKLDMNKNNEKSRQTQEKHYNDLKDLFKSFIQNNNNNDKQKSTNDQNSVNQTTQHTNIITTSASSTQNSEQNMESEPSTLGPQTKH